MQEVGGNARLILPEQRRVKTSEGEIAGQVRCLTPQHRIACSLMAGQSRCVTVLKQSARAVGCVPQRYTYITFPSETITRSGYQIRRKNFAVAAARRGQLYCLVASARGDQFSPDKEVTLRHIVDSFRLRT